MTFEHVIKYDPSSRHARGQACLNCRRRKIKCDGERPMCGQCARALGTFDDCEYYGGHPTRAQLLEEKISEVRTRIHQLENTVQSSPVEYQHPFVLDDSPSPSSSSSAYASGHLGIGPIGTLDAGSLTPPPNTRLSLHYFQEPHTDHRSLLLDAFYSQCHLFGMFLVPDRFYQSFLLPLPIGHLSRPTAALLNVVYLWGVHLSPSSPGIYDESGFLRSTLYHLSEDLSGSHPYKVMHTIQAEILLSYYYLKDGKLLEGSYHANAAMSLSLSAGLNKNLAAEEMTSVSNQASAITLPPPIDVAEEGERIDAFWAAVILNNYWIAIQESHSMLCDPLDTRVDTPWPSDSPYHIPYGESRNTLQKFIECTTVEGVSIKALHAKASVLLEQATIIHCAEYETSFFRSQALARLDYLIEQFKTTLPLSGGFNSPPLEGEAVALSHMIAHAATIRLHLLCSLDKEESRKKCVFAAKSIASITENMVSANSDQMQLDPIVGVLWIAACEVLMPEILSANTASPESSGVLVAFEAIMSRMTRFSEKSSLMKYLVDQFQQKYAARFRTLG